MKILRARAHLEELERVWSSYVASNPITARILLDPKPHELVQIHSTPPEMLPAIFGDIMHNLRCSLDLLASDLVRLNGHSPDNVYFPFAGSESDFDQMIKRRHMDRASPPVVDLLKQLKPYKGGDNALRAIHDLDIMDKHQSLLLTVIEFHTGRQSMMYEHFTLRPDDTWWSTIYEEVAATDPTTVTPALKFPGNAPLEGEEVIPVTRELIEKVLSVVVAFEILIWGSS